VVLQRETDRQREREVWQDGKWRTSWPSAYRFSTRHSSNAPSVITRAGLKQISVAGLKEKPARYFKSSIIIEQQAGCIVPEDFNFKL